MLPGIGIADEGESLVDSAAMAWTSSLSGSWWLRCLEAAGAADVERAIERTTSFLQMGQVRRRVVNHGVLQGISLSLQALATNQ